MFRCTLMADASFCNYWTVLIVKIKCIQTKKKKKKGLSRSNGLFPVFNLLIFEWWEDREGAVSERVNYREASPSLHHQVIVSVSLNEGLLRLRLVYNAHKYMTVCTIFPIKVGSQVTVYWNSVGLTRYRRACEDSGDGCLPPPDLLTPSSSSSDITFTFFFYNQNH